MILPAKFTLAAVLLAAAATTVPAAQAADDNWTGSACSFMSSNDPSGQVVMDPNTQTGSVWAGPWTVTDAGGVPASSVTITCTFQINSGVHGAGGNARSSTTAGGTGALVDTIAFTAVPGSDVYVCARIDWTTSKGSHTELLDDDGDPTNGVQCSLATSFSAVCIASDCSDQYVLVCVLSECGGGLVCIASDCDPPAPAPDRRRRATRQMVTRQTSPVSDTT